MRTEAAACGMTEVGHDRTIKSGAMLQPPRQRLLIEQRLRFLQIGCIKPLGKPAVDGARMSRTSVILARAFRSLFGIAVRTKPVTYNMLVQPETCA